MDRGSWWTIYSPWALVGVPGGLVGKEPACNAGDEGVEGLFLGLGRSPGEGKGYPLSFLAWRIQWTKEPVDYSP